MLGERRIGQVSLSSCTAEQACLQGSWEKWHSAKQAISRQLSKVFWLLKSIVIMAIWKIKIVTLYKFAVTGNVNFDTIDYIDYLLVIMGNLFIKWYVIPVF